MSQPNIIFWWQLDERNGREGGKGGGQRAREREGGSEEERGMDKDEENDVGMGKKSSEGKERKLRLG